MWNPFRKKKPVAPNSADRESEQLWDERLTHLESLFGKTDDVVGHALMPFFLGPGVGAADVVYFSTHIPGKLSVTAELIGCGDQKRSRLGNYELAIAHRTGEETWGANLISRLAHYTLEDVLQPGQTMDIGPAVPKGSKIDAFLFYDYGRFVFREEPCGVLLCVGITEKEKKACFSGKMQALLKALHDKGVYPYTDLDRESVI